MIILFCEANPSKWFSGEGFTKPPRTLDSHDDDHVHDGTDDNDAQKFTEIVTAPTLWMLKNFRTPPPPPRTTKLLGNPGTLGVLTRPANT